MFIPPIATKIHCNCDDILISGQNIVCISQDFKKTYGIWVDDGVVYVPKNPDAKDINDLHIVKISLEKFAGFGTILYTIPHQSDSSFEDIAKRAKLFLEMGNFPKDIQYIYNIPNNTTCVKEQFVNLVSNDRWNMNCNYNLQRCKLWYVLLYRRLKI